MIIPMKHVTLLCMAGERENALASLRELGSVHLNTAPTDSKPYRQAQVRLAVVRQALRVLEDARNGKPPAPLAVVGPHKVHGQEMDIDVLLNAPFPMICGDVLAKAHAILRLAAMRHTLTVETERLACDIRLYLPFGEFDVSLPGELAARGLPVQLFTAPPKTAFPRREGVAVATFDAGGKHLCGVMVGPGELPPGCEKLVPPEAPLSVLQRRHVAARLRVRQLTERMARAAKGNAILTQEVARLTDQLAFVTAADAMRIRGPVAWITGWIPAGQTAALNKTAADHTWCLLIRDPGPDEEPPTLLVPPRPFRPVVTLFKLLGISPSYHESDVSVPFFCFFSIFFAMLVSDGGYGALLILLTLWARKKLPRAPRAPFALLYVFSAATVVWGALSNTWFGFHPAALNHAVNAWLKEPGGKGDGHLMLLCFVIGAAHLSVARLWNAVQLFPDTKFIAQLGWVGVIGFMCVTAGDIVGALEAPSFMNTVLGVSVAMIMLFTLKTRELKTKGVSLGMIPLDIIACLGNIISYVRLFAVGLASVKIAETFNDMALSLNLPAFVKIPCVALILLLSHGLNMVLAGISILVHAVRLNTLEFSNHKGVSWAGFDFKPFRRNADATA
jgi:V/A-type H+-transporting ATPase subunit I